MSKHPFSDAFKCWKWQEGSACACPAWQELIQEGGAGEPSKPVRGCLFQLMPWMISSAIRQSNIAAAEASAGRRDVQQMTDTLAVNLSRGFALLALQRTQPELPEGGGS